jgi:hypothetical protein
MFAILLTGFKIGGMVLHKKIDVYYRYKTGELRFALWERINMRLGICVGVLNGAAYLILISWVIYTVSYWTIQTSAGDADPKKLKLVNRLGKDLEITGMSKVARSVDRTSPAYYDTADIAGIIYNTPLLEARLSRYPAFLGVGEQPPMQALGADNSFTELRMAKKPITALLDHPAAQGVWKNPGLMSAIQKALVPNLQDLRTYLETGGSPKFDSERLLGRWHVDVNGSIAMLRRSKPNLTSSQMQAIKAGLTAGFKDASFIATPEQQAILKNFRLKTALAGQPQTWQGQWTQSGNGYDLKFSVDGREEHLTADFEGNRLTITGSGMDLAFTREG